MTSSCRFAAVLFEAKAGGDLFHVLGCAVKEADNGLLLAAATETLERELFTPETTK